jgi:hypothetical protein
MEVYNRFRAEAGGNGSVAGITEEVRIPPAWVVGNAEHCVTELAQFIHEYGFTDFITWGVPPRIRSEQMAPRLDRVAREVVPWLKAATNSRLRWPAGRALGSGRRGYADDNKPGEPRSSASRPKAVVRPPAHRSGVGYLQTALQEVRMPLESHLLGNSVVARSSAS